MLGREGKNLEITKLPELEELQALGKKVLLRIVALNLDEQKIDLDSM